MLDSETRTARAVRRYERESPPSAADLPEVLQFMRLLWAVAHGLQTSSKRMLSTLGVTGPQRLVLRVVGLLPGISAGAVAEILHIHPSTLTGILARLIDRGLLARAAHADDRRRSLLRLTPRGTRVNLSRTGTVEAAVGAALAAMSAGDRAIMRVGLTALAEHLAKPQRATRPRRR